MRRKSAFLSGAVLSAALCALWAPAESARAAIIIDDFMFSTENAGLGFTISDDDNSIGNTSASTPPFGLPNPLLETGLPNSSGGGSASGVIGGARRSYVDATANASAGIPPRNAELSVGTVSGFAFLEADASMPGVVADYEFLWDADGAGLGGVDLTEGGVNNGLLADFVFASTIAPTDVSFFLTDTSGDTLMQTLQVGSPGESLFFDFDDFTGTGSILAIDSVRLLVEGQPGATYTLNLIAATTNIPEPATAGLLILGGAALLRRRRRLA